MSTLKKIIRYVQSHILLRNAILAVCFGIIFVLFASLMLNIFTRHGQKKSVPNFVSLTLQDATTLAKKAKVTLIVADSLYQPQHAPGTIIDQSPKAETGVKSGRKIFLTINSFHPPKEIIPYVTGLSLRQAKNQLGSKGFEIQELVYASDIATNYVISQSYKGEKITKESKVMAVLGSGVTLTVGRNERAAMPIVPKVAGYTLREAKSRVWEIGFNIGEIVYDTGVNPENYDRALVYKQIPAAGSRNGYGSKVSLHLTMDRKKVNAASDAKIETVEIIEVDSLSEDEILIQDFDIDLL